MDGQRTNGLFRGQITSSQKKEEKKVTYKLNTENKNTFNSSRIIKIKIKFSPTAFQKNDLETDGQTSKVSHRLASPIKNRVNVEK